MNHWAKPKNLSHAKYKYTVGMMNTEAGICFYDGKENVTKFKFLFLPTSREDPFMSRLFRTAGILKIRFPVIPTLIYINRRR